MYLSSTANTQHPFPIYKEARITAPKNPAPLHRGPSFPKPPSFFLLDTSTTVKLDSFTFSELQPQTRHSPIIVGDHYELAETVALQYTGEDQGDLVAKAEDPAALLPMSGYEKPQHAKINQHVARRPSQAYYSLSEYNARRPSQDPMYLQDTLPGAADPQLQQHSAAYDRQNDHMSYGASSFYQPRASFEAIPSAYSDFEPHKTPEVSSYTPDRGTKGAVVYISLTSTRDLLSPSPPIASLMFATHSVPAGLTRLEAPEQDTCSRYLVSATAPAFSETGSLNLRVPLSLQLQEQSGLDPDLIEVGDWIYEDEKLLDYRSSPQEVPRKRKAKDEPSDMLRPTKRVTPSEQQTTQSQEHGSYAYPPVSLAYKQSLQDLDFSTMERKYTAYGRSQLQQSLQPESYTMELQRLIGGTSTSQSPMRPPVGQTSYWNSSCGAGYQSGRNPQPNAESSLQVSSMSAPSPGNPTLVRSLLLAKLYGPSTTSADSSSNGSLNPYRMYPNQVVLQIRGNLNAMQENWTPEESAAKRRIVRFWREQNGTTLNAYFKPVRADEQPLPHETKEHRISCIYWQERDEYYVTSVDTIQLLESLLVSTKFGTDEKNRIRRNLETYRPCTMKKGEPDSKSLFRLIMGLPHPKPRVIEKDVKVFKWSTLEQALKKIVSKYSGVSASIAGLIGSQPSFNLNGPQSEAGASRYSALSSRSTSGSTASGAYAPTFKSNTLSPPTVPHGLSGYSQASPLQQFSAPSLPQSYTIPTLGSQYVPNSASNSPYVAQVSIPKLSSAYPASTIGRPRSNDAPIDNTLASPSYYSSRPHTSTSFPSLYAPQELSETTAISGLPGRASQDLAAYFNTDAASSNSLNDAQYRRHSGVKDETDAMQFKEE
ncbi:MAG: hypothetical protein ASARMPRED_008521 [Alectoria sarmentosa]|nr:MAG: hypothetical protein ASARMPRED_008521 [Alectoria sarmentosa]